ncbi:peptide chain release factor N(5)-glutamine methyltransferase [Litorimonas haliclonae]|uniref:peptide chain release factor N(5)-glutamine methyltransferase n=1 Tax=Litorimonas haliclonae TaxID=2081977 RepID=UPI0039F0021A
MTEQFRKAGVSFPEEDALELVLAATGMNRTEIALEGPSLLEPEVANTAAVYASRRLSGEPVDSILGWREFYGRRFKVTKDVLSPRADTELLIRCGLKALAGKKTAPTCLDLGTGSGAVLISILSECTNAAGVGVDISEEALSIARENASDLEVSNRAEFIRSEWYEAVVGRYDLILSNPPYITDAAMEELEAEVVQFDPDISLRGGPDGLEAYRAILSGAGRYLKSGGYLWVEIGYDQAETVQDLFVQSNFADIEIRKDLSGQTRCVGGKKPS